MPVADGFWGPGMGYPPASMPLNDSDVGGREHYGARYFLGYSIGWTFLPQDTLRVTVGGITQLQLGIAVIACSVSSGGVTLQLPAFKGTTTATQGAVPGPFIPAQVTIKDAGGFASPANPITIVPAAGETISGASSQQITAPYGTIWLQPDPLNGSSIVL